MAQAPVQTLHRDPQLFYWILIPITIVMVLTGVLRHYASVLMATAPKKQDEKAMREQRFLARGVALRTNHHAGTYLKEPDRKGQPPANPLSDPSAMDGMMGR
ncbi:Integral membrane protein EMC3/TMCO1-like [Fusarium oxysporum f. sp. vasinfectum]|nr:Integral membrane protein EMC3/TMCO1-like [Fusarium oxysporum f. sp. vasinfectum]